MTVPNGYFDMKAATTACGLSPSVVRMWEARYGWPRPRRMPNGYRIYSITQVDELKEVAVLVKKGTPISQIVDKDGNLNLPREPKPPTRPIMHTARAVAEPTTRTGRELRAEIIRGFEQMDPGRLLMALAAVGTVHPSDRAAACFGPACASLYDLGMQGKTIPKFSEILAALNTAMGGNDTLPATLAEMNARLAPPAAESAAALKESDAHAE